MKKNTLCDMNEEEFEKLLNEANLDKKSFLDIFKCGERSFYYWARKSKYPAHIKNILVWAAKADRYEKLISSENKIESNFLENLEVQNLKFENMNLEKEILSYKELQKLYTELFL